MVLRVEASPEVQSRLGNARVVVAGGSEKPLKPGVSINFRRMQPGENRWVGLSFEPSPGQEGEATAVYFHELTGGARTNGFGILVRPASMSRVARENMELHESVWARVDAELRIPGAKDEAVSAMELLRKEHVSDKDYVVFLRSRMEAIETLTRVVVKSAPAKDPFDVTATSGKLMSIAGSDETGSIGVVHTALLSKLDAFLTMRQLAQGDTADILQNVRWQKHLYTKRTPLRIMKSTAGLLEQSDRFIRDYGRRKAGIKDFPILLRSLLPCFRDTAQAFERVDPGLLRHVEEMERNLGDPRALQRAHRGYLLRVQNLED